MWDHNGDTRERGVALVELTFVLPLLVFLVLGALEFARLSRTIQLSTALGREAASWSYRTCADFDEPEGWEASAARTTECLQRITAGASAVPGMLSLRMLADELEHGGDFTIIVSIYRVDNNSAELRRLAVAGEEGDRGRVSRFTAAGGELRGPIGLPADAVSRRNRIVVVEVYYPFLPLFYGVPTLGSVFGRFDYYDSALL